MERVLIEVYVPVLNLSYDVFIPHHPPVHEVLELLKRAVAELSDGQYRPGESAALCYRSDGSILDINQSARRLGIHNGSRLMLI